MDTRRIHGSGDTKPHAAEVTTDTGSIDLVELVELRTIVTARHGHGLGSLLYVFALLAVLAVIAGFAIATSSGWSVLDAW